MSKDADVIVIGGGIIGCSVTYYLSKMGKKVLLLEREDLTRGSAGATDGVVGYHTKKPGKQMDLAVQSIAMFEHLGEELGMDVEYELKSGGMQPVEDKMQWDILSGIVEELLDFSRMQSGHLMMKFGRTDVVAELEEPVYLFRDRAEKSGIAMQYVEAPDIQPVLGDRDRLKQVFINVLDNAIKYSNAGGKIRVEAADMGGHVQIVVSDTGVGISKEDLPNIKNKFYKANKTRPGSGIGLALADEIIRRHKGRLDIESEEGVGTTVIITLPVAPPDAPALS